MKNSGIRYHLIDSLRGFAVINMVAYHCLYDLRYIFSIDIPWFGGYPVYIWEQLICTAFILISGGCFNLGSRRLKHGVIMFFCGCAVTVVTFLVTPGQAIRFGILSFIGAAMLIMLPLEKLLKGVSRFWGFGVSAVLFAVTKGVPNGFLGFFDVPVLYLPEQLYSTEFLAFLGFPGADFRSSDYFSIIPWLFLFFAGYYLWQIIKPELHRRVLCFKVPGLAFAGRNSLLIYIVHQPIIFAAMSLAFKGTVF